MTLPNYVIKKTLQATAEYLKEKERRRTLLRRILTAAGPREKPFHPETTFKALVTTIVSQNTNDRNTARAIKELDKRIGVTPFNLANAEVIEIARAIKSAGLYNVKAPRLKKISELICEKYDGDLEAILAKSDREVRDILTKMKGIGPKTVDVLLAFAGNRDILPVDTHVARVARRLGFTGTKSGYYEIRKELEEATNIGEKTQTHLALIWFGRNICKARKPLCSICPVSKSCPSKKYFTLEHKA